VDDMLVFRILADAFSFNMHSFAVHLLMNICRMDTNLKAAMNQQASSSGDIIVISAALRSADAWFFDYHRYSFFGR
jgi:hypothetical protein